MPTLRDVSQAEAIRVFVRFGGLERAGKESHRVVKMPTGRLLAVPKGTLKLGLIKSLIRSAEITEDEFLAELGKR